jgi:flap endonuclease-1
MGIQFGNVIKGKEIELAQLSGKKLAVDAFNTIYQFLSIIRDRETGASLTDSKGRVTSHLSGLLYRTTKLLENGIVPIYVFDGKPPAFKFATSAERRETRSAAHAEWQAALEKGAPAEEILKAAKRSVRITGEIIDTSKQLLDCMGVQWVQAPSEGEAQCAHMCMNGLAWASASQDWDSFLFGSPRLIRNLSVSGKKRLPKTGAFIEMKPELLELKNVLESFGLTREQLIMVGMLIGTDFNPGVKGYGPKKALALVKAEQTLDSVLSKVAWEGPPAVEVLDFFAHPPVSEEKLELKILQPEQLRKMMIDEHEFSTERIEKVIKTLESLRPKAGSLGKWVK